MPKLFDPEDIKKVLAGQASHHCAIKLLKEGRYGERMTRTDFRAHKACIRDVFEGWSRAKIAELTIPTLPTPK